MARPVELVVTWSPFEKATVTLGVSRPAKSRTASVVRSPEIILRGSRRMRAFFAGGGCCEWAKHGHRTAVLSSIANRPGLGRSEAIFVSIVPRHCRRERAIEPARLGRTIRPVPGRQSDLAPQVNGRELRSAPGRRRQDAAGDKQTAADAGLRAPIQGDSRCRRCERRAAASTGSFGARIEFPGWTRRHRSIA